MEKINSLEIEGGQKKIEKANLHLKVKTLLENKSWEESLNWQPNVLPSYSFRCTADWDLGEKFEGNWKMYSDLLEFANKYSLPRLVEHWHCL